MLRSIGCQPVQFTLLESRHQPPINLSASCPNIGSWQASGQVAEKKLQNVALQCKLALSKEHEAPQERRPELIETIVERLSSIVPQNSPAHLNGFIRWKNAN